MVRLIRWLVGYVEFEVRGGFSSGFVDECYAERVNLHDIRQCENGLKGICLAREYRRLHSIAHRHGATVKITKRHGLLFPILKVQRRLGLLLGAISFIIIINTLGGFIWNIEVQENGFADSAEITQLLNQNGFHEGVSWRSADLSTLENIIMATYKECAWVHINRYGSKAVVELREAVIQPTVDDSTGRANLKATKDGVIVYTNIRRGWDIVKIGSAVTKGDILASGVKESELNKTNLFTHASGEVIARVKEPIRLTVSRRQTSKLYTAEEKSRELIFFGLRIPLTLKGIDKKSCEIEEKVDYITLNNVDLPIGIATTEYKHFEVVEKTLSSRELIKLTEKEVEKRLKKDFADCEIISKKIDITLSTESATASGYIFVLENIAQEVEF